MTCNSICRHMHASDFSALCVDDGAEISPDPFGESSRFCIADHVPTPVNRGPALPMRYVSLWQEQPGPAAEKRAFRVYLTSATNAEFIVGIRTERSLRRKNVLLRAGKRRRIHLPNHGYRWRLELACTDPKAWRPADGISVYLDVDGEQL